MSYCHAASTRNREIRRGRTPSHAVQGRQDTPSCAGKASPLSCKLAPTLKASWKVAFNLRTTKALGLTIQSGILVIATGDQITFALLRCMSPVVPQTRSADAWSL